MMMLRSSPASPFGRKVRIAAELVGLAPEIELVNADTADPDDPLRQQNPLGKIPVLIIEDGTAIFDSPVIVEFLDHRVGGGRILPIGEARFPALVLQALADGIMDAALLQVYEKRWREPEMRLARWTEYQAEKVSRALARLETAPPAIETPVPHVGHIALACALGYLDLRLEGAWRSDHPRLVAWLDAFAARVPAFEKTRVTA